MRSAGKPWWQQATALVSLSAGGAITGFSFVPKAAADISSPTSLPINLLALRQSARPAPASDATLRSAIVNAAHYYLRLAEGKTPAEMEAMIWQHDSIDGVDHGESCAAFASLTLELAAQVVGQQSWVTGGASYPWPLHEWADVRVDPNPASLGIISILQDAQAHHRWHALGDGYQPLPGDWVMFNGHVEVVTKYAGGVLDTVGGDSLPNFSVNAHQYRDPLGAEGVVGFVNNGSLPGAANQAPSHASAGVGPDGPGGQQPEDQVAPGLAAIPGSPASGSPRPAAAQSPGGAAIPGMGVPAPRTGQDSQSAQREQQPARGGTSQGAPPRNPANAGSGRAGSGRAGSGNAGSGNAGLGNSAYGDVPGLSLSGSPATPRAAAPGAAAIPGLSVTADNKSARSAPSATPNSGNRRPPATAPANEAVAQQDFISQIAPGAIAAQRAYGVPAAVTIAQAIEESDWGLSELATKDHNLFGIKGIGPAGTDAQPTQEYQNGQWVTGIATFRVYHNLAESIDDHGKLLATSGYYQHAMAVRQVPNAFANALTGVYATDPDYGAKLISLMRRYNLYRYGVVAHTATSPAATSPAPTPPTRATGTPAPTPTTTASAALRAAVSPGTRKMAPRRARAGTRLYRHELPASVTKVFLTVAKMPLIRAEPLYRDVAVQRGISWKLLAACDWMQCEAQPRHSPVHGEKLGTVNPDGTIYRTKSEALEQCAHDLVELAGKVYQIDLTVPEQLSIRDLANVFAAFRWGGLLKLHHTSAMEFPYSVAGLTAKHVNMRWPNIAEPNAPDKPGGRFHMPFGAVPIVLGLNYPATV